MSTACTIHFRQIWENHSPDTEYSRAIILISSDGYPESILPDLEAFFDQVLEDTNDTRFTDASYLAAKLIVWTAMQNHERTTETNNLAFKMFGDSKMFPDVDIQRAKADLLGKNGPLNFLGIGTITDDSKLMSDYTYHVVCDANKPRNQIPEVRAFKRKGDKLVPYVETSRA